MVFGLVMLWPGVHFCGCLFFDEMIYCGIGGVATFWVWCGIGGGFLDAGLAFMD